MSMSGCSAKTAFSPNGGGTALIVKTIDSAKKQIRLAAYSFTEPAVGKSLLEAHKRGVDVAIVVDTDHNGRKPGTSVADFLASNGVPVRVTSAFKIQHNKFVVVDGATVETGSFNYSRAAESSNAENVLVISECPVLANTYLPVWKYIWETGVAVKGNY
jgi:phosphatidylserine/phosphatidylglycerophosphate/cardiolipin synthase-like enzyme